MVMEIHLFFHQLQVQVEVEQVEHVIQLKQEDQVEVEDLMHHQEEQETHHQYLRHKEIMEEAVLQEELEEVELLQ
jgi:hypothetical protein